MSPRKFAHSLCVGGSHGDHAANPDDPPHAPRQVSEMHRQLGHALPPKVGTRRAIVQKAFAVARRAAQV